MKESWNRSPNLCPMLNWYLPEETWCHLCSTEQEPELTTQSLDIYHLTSDLYTTYCTFRPLCYIVFKLYPGVNANGINILYLLAPVGSLAYTFHHIFLHKDFQRALRYYDNQHTFVHYLKQFCRYEKVHCPNPWKLFYRTGFVTLNLIGNCNRICNFYKSKISNSCFQWVPTNHCCSTGHISTHKPVSSKSYKGPQWRHSCTI